MKSSSHYPTGAIFVVYKPGQARSTRRSASTLGLARIGLRFILGFCTSCKTITRRRFFRFKELQAAFILMVRCHKNVRFNCNSKHPHKSIRMLASSIEQNQAADFHQLIPDPTDLLSDHIFQLKSFKSSNSKKCHVSSGTVPCDQWFNSPWMVFVCQWACA